MPNFSARAATRSVRLAAKGAVGKNNRHGYGGILGHYLKSDQQDICDDEFRCFGIWESLIQRATQNLDLGRGHEAEGDSVALNLDNFDSDVAVDNQRLTISVSLALSANETRAIEHPTCRILGSSGRGGSLNVASMSKRRLNLSFLYNSPVVGRNRLAR